MSDIEGQGKIAKYDEMAGRLRAIRGRVMLTQLPTSEVATKDELELITAGRFGDLLISDWETERNNLGEVRCVCGCGEIMTFTVDRLQAMVYTNWERQHLMTEPDVLANSAAQPYWCEHIYNGMARTFPSLDELHKKAMTQIRRSCSRRQGVAYTLGWMDRTTGLLDFVKDVGLPPQPGMDLVRVSSPGHTGENFRWVVPNQLAGVQSSPAPKAEDAIGPRGTIILTDAQLRKLNSRYTSLRSRVLTEGKGFGWNSFSEFLESVKRKAPSDFVPEAYQLRFINTETYGYCEASLSFHLLGTARRYANAKGESKVAPRNYARAPWNAAIELEEMAETWPLMNLDLSPKQFMMFVIELSRLMSSVPGDIHEHIAAARATAASHKV